MGKVKLFFCNTLNGKVVRTWRKKTTAKREWSRSWIRCHIRETRYLCTLNNFRQAVSREWTKVLWRYPDRLFSSLANLINRWNAASEGRYTRMNVRVSLFQLYTCRIRLNANIYLSWAFCCLLMTLLWRASTQDQGTRNCIS